MNGITFKVFSLSEREQDLLKQGLLDYGDTIGEDQKEVTFYNIDYVSEYTEEMAIVSSGGLDFITNESRDKVNKKIRFAQLHLNN